MDLVIEENGQPVFYEIKTRNNYDERESDKLQQTYYSSILRKQYGDIKFRLLELTPDGYRETDYVFDKEYPKKLRALKNYYQY